MKYIITFFLCLFFLTHWGQKPLADTLKFEDTVNRKQDIDARLLMKKDTLKQVVYTPQKEHLWAQSYREVIQKNNFFNCKSNGKEVAINRKKRIGKESIFYLLAGLMLFFGLIKVIFEKYLKTLSKVFFNASIKQKQLREQLLQTPLPSLLMNIFFVLVFGLFAAFVVQYYQITAIKSFWWLFLYAVSIISVIYMVKYLMLKFTGWVFNLKEVTDSYVFIVFLVSKWMSIVLLPLIILMAFANNKTTIAWITLAYVIIGFSFLYRYFSAYGPVRREIKVNQLHFFLYLCALEIAPLLLLYKVAMNFLDRTV